MAKFRPVYTTIWEDDFMDQADTSEKLFYLFLLTNPKTTQCGIYRLRIKDMVHFTGFSSEQCSLLIERFREYGKILHDQDNQEVMICNWPKFNLRKGGKPIYDLLKKELAEVKSEWLIVYMLESMDDTVSQTIKGIYEKQVTNRTTIRTTIRPTSRTTIRGQNEEEEEYEYEEREEEEKTAPEKIVKADAAQAAKDFYTQYLLRNSHLIDGLRKGSKYNGQIQPVMYEYFRKLQEEGEFVLLSIPKDDNEAYTRWARLSPGIERFCAFRARNAYKSNGGQTYDPAILKAIR